jgi:hypothetical protein
LQEEEGVFNLRVLLVKPRTSALHFGLAPFFQTEPLGLEYISAALGACGHRVRIVDMCFERRTIAQLIRSFRPEIVGISCLHILDVVATLQLAREIKRVDPAIFVAVGGHAVASYPKALEHAQGVDAICVGEGESALHHLLWKPRLPVHRFFELYCETWRRTVLNTAGRKKWWQWLRGVDLRNIGHMARILARSQQLMDPRAYLAECRIPTDLE